MNADKKDLTGDGKVTLSDDLQARVDMANNSGADPLGAIATYSEQVLPALRGTRVG